MLSTLEEPNFKLYPTILSIEYESFNQYAFSVRI